jgi:hypothetical protein
MVVAESFYYLTTYATSDGVMTTRCEDPIGEDRKFVYDDMEAMVDVCKLALHPPRESIIYKANNLHRELERLGRHSLSLHRIFPAPQHTLKQFKKSRHRHRFARNDFEVPGLADLL